jgi:hypothetical protein
VLLQDHGHGLLPSRNNATLGPSAPHGLFFRRGRVHFTLRPAAPHLLASTPASQRTPENLLSGSPGGLPERDSHPPIVRPFAGHTTI